MKKITIVLVLAMSLGFLGCAGMTDTQQRTLSGAAIGAAAGTAIGAMSGSAGWGAAIGAAAGAGAGYIYDKQERSGLNFPKYSPKEPGYMSTMWPDSSGLRSSKPVNKW